ncbi:ABC transporter ATP-binding protein [Paenibacillus whitsoniae]|uniref:ABC transporter ATP-binding protein n=1 Tax=Paenibacillus whitsoniae TaxID=2496558 RepID=A0A3S0ARP6_9BACL|nr:ABC transporter ATP-binding protein [Paenibacillus whitsoniae]RTE11022.1 ABC transporter ATP-binding protein [Paenibacillus whitsoniae]
MLERQSETILQVRNLQVTYRQNQATIPILDQLGFDMNKGEILALLGESGSGKSTIAKAVTGLLPPSANIASGTLQIGSTWHVDMTIKSKVWDQIRGRGISMLFQDAQLALNPVLKIKENFKEILLFHRMAAKDEVMSIAVKMLSMLNFKEAQSKSILECYPFELSGGMCQRVCLALALCLKPSVLIADEPTSALDTVSQKEVLDLLKKMQAELGLTILLITHDIAVANAISNRVIVLNKGIIEEEGNTSVVLSKPRTAYTKQLLASRLQIVKPSNDRVELLHHSEPLLQIRKLEKTFHSKKRVLHDIDLTLNSREILGILGQSGCGKSTLAKCIVGLESPSGGSVLYRGVHINRLQGKYRREMSRKIQLVFQDARASLHPGRSALELVQEPLQYLQIGTRKERKEQATYYLNEVGITGDLLNRRPPQLSTGQCQRIAIARALVLEPEVLICDEAVSALDMSVRAQILALLQRLHQQFDFAILMISHDIHVLRNFCHHIAVMNNGSISETKRPSELLHESSQPHTQLLLKCAGDLEQRLYEGRMVKV